MVQLFLKSLLLIFPTLLFEMLSFHTAEKSFVVLFLLDFGCLLNHAMNLSFFQYPMKNKKNFYFLKLCKYSTSVLTSSIVSTIFKSSRSSSDKLKMSGKISHFFLISKVFSSNRFVRCVKFRFFILSRF